MKNPRHLGVIALCALIVAAGIPVFGQDFGFAAEDEDAPGSSRSGISGWIDIGAAAPFASFGDPSAISLGDLAASRIEFSWDSGKFGATAALMVSKSRIASDPASLVDTAVLSYFGEKFWFEGGLMKLSWGRADSQGPLDVTNPLDLRDLTVSDPLERKIAMPMLRARYSLNQASALEAVFIPSFAGHRMALDGIWAPAALKSLAVMVQPGKVLAAATEDLVPRTTLNNFQAGARFSASLVSVDLGLQYFYGFLPTPAASVLIKGPPGDPNNDVSFSYNRYQQVGADFAFVAAGFSFRGEVAANLTGDLAGSDPEVYNPAIAYSLGFDRDLFGMATLNLQYSGSYRINNGAIVAPLDIETGKPEFASTLTGMLTRSFFKDKVGLSLGGIWGLSSQDFLLMPKITFVSGDAEASVQAGIFGGLSSGDLGQYAESSYLKVNLRYRF